jgi:hypothetical protein
MGDENDHSSFVNAWMERAQNGLPRERLLQVLEQTVLGNLTAEILTPALHSELSKLALEERGTDEKES